MLPLSGVRVIDLTNIDAQCGLAANYIRETSPPPRLGEHTRAVLEETRFAPRDIEVLSRQRPVTANIGESS